MAGPVSLPFADAAFDSVWAVDALAGLPPEQWDDVVRELGRVAEPGAPIAVVLPVPDPRSAGDTAHGFTVLRSSVAQRGLHGARAPTALTRRAAACPRLEAWLPSTHSPVPLRPSMTPPSSRPRRP